MYAFYSQQKRQSDYFISSNVAFFAHVACQNERFHAGLKFVFLVRHFLAEENSVLLKLGRNRFGLTNEIEVKF